MRVVRTTSRPRHHVVLRPESLSRRTDPAGLLTIGRSRAVTTEPAIPTRDVRRTDRVVRFGSAAPGTGRLFMWGTAASGRRKTVFGQGFS